MLSFASTIGAQYEWSSSSCSYRRMYVSLNVPIRDESSSASVIVCLYCDEGGV